LLGKPAACSVRASATSRPVGPGHIPTAPAEVAACIPAELLRRRPDVRRAERLAAAQSAQIGVAEAEFYLRISITGSLGYGAGFPLLAKPAAFGPTGTRRGFDGNIGPAFPWNILQYGRIINNVRLQDARFQELVGADQGTDLTAAREVARVTQIELNLVPLLDTLAQARGEICLGLIQVYGALGGGWQLRLISDLTAFPPPPGLPPAPGTTSPFADVNPAAPSSMLPEVKQPAKRERRPAAKADAALKPL
jgi:outer membrane protein TolC